MEDIKLKRGWLRRHYHWVIFAVIFVHYFIMAGMSNNTYSLYTIPVSEDLGISRSAFSLSSALGSIPAFFGNLIFAYFYNRYGFRKMAVIGLVLSGVMFNLYSITNTVFVFYVGACLMALLSVFYSNAGIARLIPDWFHRHQGLVLGLVFAASGVGASTMSVVLSSIITKYSWRMSYRVTGFLYLVLAVLILVFVRSKPADMGLQPLGDAHEAQAERKKHARKTVKEWDGIPLNVLVKRPYFYLTLLCLFLVTFMTYTVYPTFVPHMQDQGMTQAQAAQVQSLMFLFLSAAKILEGWLSDRICARRVMFLCITCGIVSAILLAEVQTSGMAIAGAAVHSLALTVSTIMLPVLTADLFGRHSYGTILGIVLATIRLATGTAPTVSNAFFDATGSYTGIYYIIAADGAVAMVLFFIVFRASEKERKALKEEEK